MQGTKVGSSYDVQNVEGARAAYDTWAGGYEPDLMAMGYRLPWVFAAICVRYLDPELRGVLDVGCGGGMQAEPLKLMGYHYLEGADISSEMLAVARAKNLYSDLHQITLGEALPFANGSVPAVLSCGVITPGHAPADALDELVRITQRGGLLIYSMRDDPEQQPEYPAKRSELIEKGAVRELFRTDAFTSIPYGEPDVRHRVHVCEVMT